MPPQFASASGATTLQRQRRAVRNVVLACVAVLVLGQLLIGALSLAALLRLGADSTADRLSLIAGRSASQIQAGLQLGKPLTQYFGLSLVFDRLRQDIPELVGAAVVLDDGTVLAASGAEINSGRLLTDLKQGAPRARASTADGLLLALPLAEPGDGHKGALLIAVNVGGLPDDISFWDNLWFLALVTAMASAVMVLAMRRLPVQRIAAAGWIRLAIPLAIMLIAQAAYTLYTVNGFREVWHQVIHENARIIGQGIERDLERVLAYGIEPSRMRGVDQPMARAIQAFPLLGGMQLLDADGDLLAQTGKISSKDVVLNFSLEAKPAGPTLATLKLYANEAAMRAEVRARALDAATIAVVAMVAAIELMLMLQVLMDRAFAPSGTRDDPSRLGMVARPVMFAFLFAMSLPLGFLPLYAGRLLDPTLDPSVAVMLVGMPTVIEMGAGLATALLAGRLIDRSGWLRPAMWGMGLALAGYLACALAHDLWTLALARGVTGLGYGLVWMALQGFVVKLGPPAYRGRNMTALIAGLFAGHMTGAAVGGMLANQMGHRLVFLVGAVMVLIAAYALRSLLWPYRNAGAERPAPGVAQPVSNKPARAGLSALLRDRGYLTLMLGSIVPFSIAQVGLLSYALPLYFDAHGATTADVGRVIMLYGFCVIYMGPLLGRATDRSRHWKHWISAGGVVGATGLLMLHWAPGLVGVTAAVLLLAIASCLAGAAQTPYMLAREAAQSYGAAGATGIMRGADKFGQMLGPLVVGGLFASVGMSGALVWTGALYLAGTLLVLLMAPSEGHRRD